MSFNLPSLKVQPSIQQSAGLSENGLNAPSQGVKSLVTKKHPVQYSQEMYDQQQERLHLNVLRNTQGLHAPLRLTMEKKNLEGIGHLPFLPSHNVLLDSLTGKDLEMRFEDIYNTGVDHELMLQPHAVVEAQMGIL